MLQYVFNKLPFGNGHPNRDSDSSSEDEDNAQAEDEDSAYPQYTPKEAKNAKPIGLISKQFNAASLETKEEGSGEADDKEWVKSIGIITRLDESMPKGVIDRTYFFDIATFCTGRHRFHLQASVEFEAFKSKSCPSWVVTSMKLHISKKEEQVKERQRHKTHVVKVQSLNEEFIEVKWGDNKFQKIPLLPSILPKYKIKPGDWLKIHFEQIFDENRLNEEELCSSETLGKIVSIEPNRMKTIVGKITKRGNEYCVDDDIYVTADVIKAGRTPPLNTLVRCVAVDSTQKLGYGELQWRAVEMSLSTYMQYTGDAHNRDEDGYFDEKEVSLRYRDMYANRAGIVIKPELYVKFQATKIGTSVSKMITVENKSQRSITFVKIVFPHDNSICKFDLEMPQKERDAVRTMAPGDSYSFQVICTPLQMGRTKEMGVFDFGDFKIARDFVITGLSPDEDLLSKIKKPDDGFGHRPSYQRIRGAEQIEGLIKDNNRTRIRGNAPIRAPFFAATRIPRYTIPNDIWEAYKSKDEGIIKRNYGGALQNLDFKNYSDKFKVSLWFEEVDNDIRRRQYDLQGVRFKKVGDNFTFNAPYLHDITPPVLVGDPIDCFDPDEPENTNLKYQGFIKKLVGTDVYVVFSETFNLSYQGVPLTVRFCLGRMTYKRQHFAVDRALQNLGATFLFPFGLTENEVQVPRIPFFEDDSAEDDPIDSTTTAVVETEEESVSYLDQYGLFKTKQDKQPKLRPSTSEPKENKMNKRAQSLRTPFLSDCITTKFLKDVRLRWFNNGLNEEQKNAVRRILRGQARPLPYIIYGPPGTGKTVTVVEAIMQVNKLDPNSRILVTAPTNHAADVIAEHLVNSGQYHPGEFIRFNGFMRQEQVVIEVIREFCVDGEFLDSVARNRLIVATCTTAGQFFSLNLTPGHFTHVFIDEAGYCTEPESMISAVNLDTSKGGQLILAGDPNQLGPVLMSDIAQNLHLNVSFLERLMKGKKAMANVYDRNQEKYGNENCGYNPLVLTKLVRNYRAHESLLKLPSRLFYNDDLVSCASHEEAYALTQDRDIIEHVLLAQGVPIVFHGVQGNSIRERDSPSWCNTAEIMQVVSYVRKLKQCGVKNEDIGIITPYRKQAEKLRIAMQLGMLEDETPKVGSVEEFQGGERQVVIISTVRSLYEEKIDASVNKLGFIFNEKRFNVAITRAKSLMIIVGNPHVLWKDKRWNDLLRYCLELRAYTGCNLPVELDEVANKLYAEHQKQEEQRRLPTLPPDMPTSTYNPEGLDEDEFVDALA